MLLLKRVNTNILILTCANPPAKGCACRHPLTDARGHGAGVG